MLDDRLRIFETLKKELKKFAKKPIIVRDDLPGRYHLWSEKEGIVAYGRERKDIFFAGLIIQSTYVGFYFMPVYGAPELKKVFSKELLSTLKGKACFHIKKLDAKLLSDIKKALLVGKDLYKKQKWI